MPYQSFQCQRTLNYHTGVVAAIAITSDGQTLMSGSWDRTIKIWDLKACQVEKTLEGHQGYVTCVALSPDGQILASGSWDETVKIWDFHTGSVKHTLEPYAQESGRELASLVFSPDGQILYSGSRGGSTYYWDVLTGELLGNLGIISLGSSLLAMSADGRTLAGVKSGSFTVRSLPDRKRRFEIETRHNSPSLAISPDGETVYIGDYKGKIHLWDSRKGQELSSLGGHSGIVTSVAVSRDGKILASGEENGTIKLWQLDSKTEVCTLEGHTADVMALVFSPDGQTLVSSSADTTIKVWGVV